MSDRVLPFSRSHGAMSEPGAYTWAMNNTPVGLDALRDIVQANLAHVFWAERYGLMPVGN